MNSETKRPNQTPEFNERANEDSYFGAKEHALIEALKVEYIQARAARRAVRMTTCPKCLGQFEKYPFMGLLLDRCENCEGIWLNKGELAGILRQQARGPLAMFIDRCFAKTETSTKR
jgi:Zn-finger nucleic acid-binding protein